MSRLKRDIRGKKLRNLLARADDEAFLQMLWAVGRPAPNGNDDPGTDQGGLIFVLIFGSPALLAGRLSFRLNYPPSARQ
jgi:hypothetical protein